MTTGTVLLNRSPFSYYYKYWEGANWSSPTSPNNIFGSYWKKVEGASSIPSVKFRFEKVRGLRAKPRRALIEDHAYYLRTNFWVDPIEFSYDRYNNWPPFDYIGTESKRFRAVFGEGYVSDMSSVWTSNDTIALIGKLREKVVGSDFDLGVFLGEGREACDMIAKTANRIYGYYRGLMKLDARAVARATGIDLSRAEKVLNRARRPGDPVAVRLSRANLELQYGWLPLLSDAHGAAQALAQQLNNPPVQTYRARMRKPHKVTSMSPLIKSYFFYGETRGQLIGRLTAVNSANLNGLLNPATVAWELLPYSFVVDWFIPIGNFLQAWSFSTAVSGTFVQTLTRREIFEVTALGDNPGGGFTVMKVHPDYRSRRTWVDRTVSSSLSVPRPTFKPLNEVFSWRRAANAVSLVTVASTNWRPGFR